MKIYKQEFIEIEKIKEYENNSRTHSEDQIYKIMESIVEYGFTNPILIDENYNLIAGHGRLRAILELNKTTFKENPISKVPCIIISGLDEVKRKTLIIADNRLAELAGWDYKILKEEIIEIESMGGNVDILDFDLDELDDLIDEIYRDDDLEVESVYTSKIVTPIYEITGEKPKLVDLIDLSKTKEKLEMIEKSSLKEEEKTFLKFCCYRFMDFDFSKIAEYYAHSDKEMQELMESLALVIIDYDKSIEEGYIKMNKNLERVMNE